MRVVNEKYRAFLRGELMATIPRDEFDKVLTTIKHRQLKQARALCILLWMTGKRPNEILNITAGDISKANTFIKINIKGSKGGYSTPTLLPLKDKLVEEVWNLSKDKFPDQYLFWAFRSKSKKKGAVKKIRKKQTDGSYQWIQKTYTKEYNNLANRLHYWFSKWFKVPAYYFRHNRLTLAAAKLDVNQLMLLKGAKTMESVRPYLHYSEKTSKKIAGELVK